MLRLRAEVGKGLEMDRHAVAAFQCVNAGANVFLGKLVCRPRTRFDIAKVELYSVVPTIVAGATPNVLNVCVGKPGVAALVVAAVDPNAVVLATYATLAITDVTVNVLNLDIPRRLLITAVDNAGADLKLTVTVTGRDQEGKPITEVIAKTVAGTGTKVGIKQFKSVSLVTLVIDAGAADALDTFALGTIDEGVIATADPDDIVAGVAPAAQALLPAAYNVPANTPVWVQLVTDNGSVAAPFDVGAVVHWEPYIGAYDGEAAYGAYDA